MKTAFRIIPWLILSIPFVILSFCYNSLPNEILIAQSFFSDESIMAPKSLFSVFRVPLIELVCGAIVEIMRWRGADSKNEKAVNYYSMWSILLYTVSLKSLFQALEIISLGNTARLFYYLTLGIVIGGIILAFFKIRKVFSDFSRNDWKLSLTEKIMLVILLAAYLSLAFIPTFVFK